MLCIRARNERVKAKADELGSFQIPKSGSTSRMNKKLNGSCASRMAKVDITCKQTHRARRSRAH